MKFHGPAGGPGSDTTAIHKDQPAEISTVANLAALTGNEHVLIEDPAAGTPNTKKEVTTQQIADLGGGGGGNPWDPWVSGPYTMLGYSVAGSGTTAMLDVGIMTVAAAEVDASSGVANDSLGRYFQQVSSATDQALAYTLHNNYLGLYSAFPLMGGKLKISRSTDIACYFGFSADNRVMSLIAGLTNAMAGFALWADGAGGTYDDTTIFVVMNTTTVTFTRTDTMIPASALTTGVRYLARGTADGVWQMTLWNAVTGALLYDQEFTEDTPRSTDIAKTRIGVSPQNSGGVASINHYIHAMGLGPA